LTLIGKVNSAKNTSANAAVANAVTAAKVVLSEGNETTAVGQQAAIADAISGSNVTVAVAPGPGDITLTGTRGATATVTQLGAVTKTNAS
jgi:hypothetical protein